MLGLRQKLTLAFAGLLGVLLVVGTMSTLLLTGYSATLQRIFRENYDSVLYARRMQEAVDGLDDFAERALWNEASPGDDAREREVRRFEQSLAAERSNLTLPGEAAAV